MSNESIVTNARPVVVSVSIVSTNEPRLSHPAHIAESSPRELLRLLHSVSRIVLRHNLQ